MPDNRDVPPSKLLCAASVRIAFDNGALVGNDIRKNSGYFGAFVPYPRQGAPGRGEPPGIQLSIDRFGPPRDPTETPTLHRVASLGELREPKLLRTLSSGRPTTAIPDPEQCSGEQIPQSFRLAWPTKPQQRVAFIVVAHDFEDLQPLLKFLGERGQVELLVVKGLTRSKPDSFINRQFAGQISYVDRGPSAQTLFCHVVDRAMKGHDTCCILDHGGYFASCVHDSAFNEDLSRRLRFISHIVENTTNGVREYEKALAWFQGENSRFGSSVNLQCAEGLTVRIRSVASCEEKSPLQAAVAKRIKESAASLLASYGKNLSSMCVGIIGFGQLGQRLAALLAPQNIFVYDNSPKLSVCLANSLRVNKRELLQKSQVIFCMTGNGSLDSSDLRYMQHETWVVSGTSANDEMPGLLPEFTGRTGEDRAESKTLCIDTAGKRIYLLTGGNAVNLATGPSEGAAVERVHAATLKELARGLAGTSDGPGSDILASPSMFQEAESALMHAATQSDLQRREYLTSLIETGQLGVLKHLLPRLPDGHIWCAALLSMQRRHDEARHFLGSPDAFHAASLSLGERNTSARQWLLSQAITTAQSLTGSAPYSRWNLRWLHDFSLQSHRLSARAYTSHAQDLIYRTTFGRQSPSGRKVEVPRLECENSHVTGFSMLASYVGAIGDDPFSLSMQAFCIFNSFYSDHWGHADYQERLSAAILLLDSSMGQETLSSEVATVLAGVLYLWEALTFNLVDRSGTRSDGTELEWIRLASHFLKHAKRVPRNDAAPFVVVIALRLYECGALGEPDFLATMKQYMRNIENPKAWLPLLQLAPPRIQEPLVTTAIKRLSNPLPALREGARIAREARKYEVVDLLYKIFCSLSTPKTRANLEEVDNYWSRHPPGKADLIAVPWDDSEDEKSSFFHPFWRWDSTEDDRARTKEAIMCRRPARLARLVPISRIWAVERSTFDLEPLEASRPSELVPDQRTSQFFQIPSQLHECPRISCTAPILEEVDDILFRNRRTYTSDPFAASRRLTLDLEKFAQETPRPKNIRVAIVGLGLVLKDLHPALLRQLDYSLDTLRFWRAGQHVVQHFGPSLVVASECAGFTEVTGFPWPVEMARHLIGWFLRCRRELRMPRLPRAHLAILHRWILDHSTSLQHNMNEPAREVAVMSHRRDACPPFLRNRAAGWRVNTSETTDLLSHEELVALYRESLGLRPWEHESTVRPQRYRHEHERP